MGWDIVLTDPPWQQSKGNLRKCRPMQGKKLDYKTLKMQEIKDIHYYYFKQCSVNHNVFMWTIDKYLFETEGMMSSLGYTLHARMIWDKLNGVAPAYTVRFSHEYLLWFYPKGYMLKPCAEIRGIYKTVFCEKSKKHSQKPMFVYEMIERMFPNSTKLELFARNKRDGWMSLGNEIDGTDFLKLLKEADHD